MLFRKFNRTKAPLILLAFSAFWLPAYAEPEISSSALVENIQSGTKNILVYGSGFGTKSQAAPVLVDRVEVAYENGQLSALHSAVDAAQVVLRSSDSNESLWEKSSLNIDVDTSRASRHSASSSHYYFEGENNFLGWPNAYGGTNTSVDNRQLYLSWWYKPKFDPGSYWAFTAESINGTFKGMETLLVEGGYEGTYIGIDRDGLINAVFPGLGSNSLKGKRIKGALSGATTIFPSESRKGSGSGYETPGSQKLARIWEDPNGGDGIRLSWTQMHQTLSSHNNVSGVVNWENTPLNAGQWNHLELELDTVKGRVRLFLNGENFSSFEFDPSLDQMGKWSPTIAGLGLNGKVGKLQEGEIDDIYFDKTVQRVLIGDAAVFSDLKNYELQRPVSWKDNEIEVSLFLGQFSGRENLHGLYLYVFDKHGNVNSRGYEICEDCKAPPAKTPLSVE
ncbi:hypothetical protein [Marinobacter sp. F3R08]|uniref:hypothetical protein n=1 Tax=Marinobacter sp. F3R08 TaxID=2841559 RepID=UPI001C0A5B4D|nr:hypothetical protein [Marinobacter sp. F3R08]MBU2955607.1 hypothetical protein [Marinobacter sp. F3R08]